jgi:hypothetical protein
MAGSQATGFESVLSDELKLLNKLRDTGTHSDKSSTYEQAYDFNLAGLSFSGGGIRSATFNLGVIQALANYGLLSKFDYLSTVSGGGYIGSWLTALLHRTAEIQGQTVDQKYVDQFQQYLKTHPTEDHPREDKDSLHTFKRTIGFAPVEHKAVRFLRRYSNYISPRLGLSGDMLAAISIFLRNLVLIQLALISLVAALLLLVHMVGILPRFIAPLFSKDFLKDFVLLNQIPPSSWAFIVPMLVLFVAVWFTGQLMVKHKVHFTKPGALARRVLFLIITPCLLAAWWFSAAVANHPEITTGNNSYLSRAIDWIWIVGAGYAIAWGLGFTATLSKSDRKPGKNQLSNFTLLVSVIIVGALFGLTLYGIVQAINTAYPDGSLNLWYAVGFGPPLFLIVLMFFVTIHIGAARRRFSEQDREWLARLGGFMLLSAAGWALAFCLILFTVPLVYWLSTGGLVALFTWATGSGVGVWFARGASTDNGQKDKPWKDIITQVAPWLFIAGLVVIITYVTQLILFKYLICSPFPGSDQDLWFSATLTETLSRLSDLPWLPTLGAALGMAGLFLLIARRLDINLFSLHAMYCNRLARAYLGASRAGKREPNPFTGFDKNDDFHFSDLQQQRPIPIINTAINMTGGDDLAWQTRRAASFSFTPQWAGYETNSSQGVKIGGYQPTAEYAEGKNLGTLVAVSGAAASPNMGYHTSPAVAALLTAFNLRLGRWCGNPVRSTWNQNSPKLAVTPILAELTGSATAQASWINLTDGGHFENLGVYELVRRRCRFILVVDAGCDPKYQYDDLANLLRLCWTDLGVNIRFDNFDPMHPQKDSRYIASHAMIGRIQYGHDEPEGVILYVKASMTGDEWPDIRQYADAHKEFPHETTADQFFDENQFESYRHLGYKAIATIVEKMELELGTSLRNLSVVDLLDILGHDSTDEDKIRAFRILVARLTGQYPEL